MSKSIKSLLTPIIGIPVPPSFGEILGYRGTARYVGYYWKGGELCWHDGQAGGNNAQWHAWRLWEQHPRVAPYLQPFEFVNDYGAPKHWLVLDRLGRRIYAGAAEVARAALEAQHGTSAVMTKAWTLDESEIQALIARLETHSPAVSKAVLAKEQEKQRERERALRDWLEQGGANGA